MKRDRRSYVLFLFMAIAFLTFFSLLTLRAEDAKKKNVAVLGLKAVGKADPADAEGLVSAILKELNASPLLVAIDRRDMDEAVKEQVLSASGACDTNCKIEFGKIVQSKWAVTGELNKIGSTYYITLKVLDVETTETIHIEEEKYAGPEDGLWDTAKTVAARVRNFLEGGKVVIPPSNEDTTSTPPATKEKATGALKITTTPPGATVILGADNVGRTPLTLTVPAKKHTLTLSLTGYVDISKAVTIEKDKTTEVTEEFVLQTGAISVSSAPVGASVELDGSYKGTTPLELKNVSMGTHTVKVSLEDYAEQSKAVEVKYKDTAQVNFNLSGLPGKLAVTSTPQNASVSVDGKDAGKTPLYGYSVQSGSHTVKVSLSGYKTQTQEFEISPNQEKPFNFTLEAIKTSTIKVSSTPSGARVIFNNKERGETPLTLSDVPAGTYKLVLKKQGYKEFWGEVTLSEGEEKEVAQTLEEQKSPPLEKGDKGGFDKGDMVLIPASEFTMGSNDYDNEKPPHKVYLDAYSIDKYEVTNAQYKECVSAGKCKKPQGTKWYNDSSKANHPVVYVDWNQSSAYCTWAGKRLPTEAEWEKASRGEQGNVWPWGNEFDCKKSCNSVSPCSHSSTCEVGSFSSDVSSYGVYDMGGNVWEWVSDWYDKDYYKNSPENNPKGPNNGQYRGLRGGSWNVGYPFNLRGASRNDYVPTYRVLSGFRCASSPD